MLRRFYTLLVIVFLTSPALALVAAAQRPVPGRVALLALCVLAAASTIPVIVLRWHNPRSTSFMRLAQRALRKQDRAATLARQWVAYHGIAPVMRLAAVVAEDLYFPFHSGFDWESIRQAYQYNRTVQEAGLKRGASTISQQVAKNLFLPPLRNYLRKLAEAYLTVLIEGVWPKRRILEVYLNVAQFGADLFGVEAAARRFWGKAAADLTAQEAALLAAVLPDPAGSYRADAPSHVVRFRQVMILNSMKKVGEGYLTLIEGQAR